ncbi:hypothetical protein ACFYKX_12975 [Cytobacillus sp. FJAT-54145]|uniref:Uncharacterized protein n=1 Tax=Cytobacillus spartinae TaxID=3299023 RepID=A0ABW6KE21_9BACI
MPCILENLTQPVCLTLIYNLSSRILVDSFIDCGACKLETELDPVSRNLTIRVPLIVEGEVTFTDNPFVSGCVTTGVRLGTR